MLCIIGCNVILNINLCTYDVFVFVILLIQLNCLHKKSFFVIIFHLIFLSNQ
jgi:hypothetical protein